MPSTRRYIPSYEDSVVLMTSLAVGLTTFDRLAITFVTPHLVRDLQLSNLQLGVLSAALSLAIAFMGFAVGSLSDLKGWRKQLLLPALGLFVGFAVLSGFAASFIALLVTRLLMGMVQGPINMISQSIIALESSDHRRGRNLGMQALLIFIMGPVLGPLLVTRVAEAWSWHAVFFVTSVPAVVLTVMIAIYMKPVRTPIRTQTGSKGPAERSTDRRNVALCMLIATMIMTWLVVQNTFLPLYLVGHRGMTPEQMGFMLSVQGAAACLGGLALPALSDRIGRRPTLILAALAGVVSPLGALLIDGPVALLGCALFVGGLANGAMPLYAVVIPSESVTAARVARTIAMIIGTGELCGGVIAPVLAGQAADLLGAGAPLWIVAAAACIAALLATGMRETSPMRRAATAAVSAPAGAG
jgi:ACS family hexuronate transporter-like MFS transporter